MKTQLIAHDKEVYDIAFSRAGGGKDMFASVGKSFSIFQMIVVFIKTSVVSNIMIFL